MTLRQLEIELGEPHPLAEVRRFFGCSESKLRAMCATGEVRATFMRGPNGRNTYGITEQEIRRWRAEHDTKTTRR